MNKPTTSLRRSVELPLSLNVAPGPFPECDVCGVLDRERRTARARGDMSKVSDCNVEIRQHPHDKGRCP
jgi:hypothetical protein